MSTKVCALLLIAISLIAIVNCEHPIRYHYGQNKPSRNSLNEIIEFVVAPFVLIGNAINGILFGVQSRMNVAETIVDNLVRSLDDVIKNSTKLAENATKLD